MIDLLQFDLLPAERHFKSGQFPCVRHFASLFRLLYWSRESMVNGVGIEIPLAEVPTPH
jgi:hypothetical protein